MLRVRIHESLNCKTGLRHFLASIVAHLRSRGLLYLLQQLIRGPHFSYPFLKTWFCTLLFEFKCLGHGGYLNFTYFREKSSELGFFPRTWHSVWNFCFQAPWIWFVYNVHLYNNCAIFHLLVKSSLGFGIKCNWIFLIELFLIDWFFRIELFLIDWIF